MNPAKERIETPARFCCTIGAQPAVRTDRSARLYELSLRLYEGFSRDIGFNIMLSQRGILTLAHNTHQLEMLVRWLNAMHLNGIDGEVLGYYALAMHESRLTRWRLSAMYTLALSG